MKRFPLLPHLALVFAVASACTDSTAPANSHSLLSPRNPTATRGDPPPPPVDVAIAVTINSPGQAVFTGVFFNNGFIHDDGVDATETFDGTAWLRLDNKQPSLFNSGIASPNARFMVKGDDTTCPVDPSTCATGKGTLTVEGVEYTIVSVQSFKRFSFCERGVEASPCAVIAFTVTDPAGNSHNADLFAFDRASCIFNTEGLSYNCGFPPPDSSEG